VQRLRRGDGVLDYPGEESSSYEPHAAADFKCDKPLRDVPLRREVSKGEDIMATIIDDSPIIEVLEQRKSLMNVKEVAKVTGLSIPTVYRRVHAKTLPAVKFGYVIKFDPHQIAQWIREHYAS